MSHRSQRPPPLQLLVYFDAAARLLSFSKAAAELHVTAAAVSQQIKQLEKHLGLPLFNRLIRRIELTEAGISFFAVVSETLSVFHQGHKNFVHQFLRPSLTMSVTPLVAHHFLIPNLSRFQQANPGIDIRLESNMDAVDFEQNDIDLAIRVGSGIWAGLSAWPLCKCNIIMLTSKELLEQKPVRSLADLKEHTLIHPRNSKVDWGILSQLLHLPGLEGKNDLILDSDLAAWRAAQQGLGITLCLLPTGAPAQMLRDQGLVTVIPPIENIFMAYFVFRQNSGKDKLLKGAFQWIKEHLEQFTEP